MSPALSHCVRITSASHFDFISIASAFGVPQYLLCEGADSPRNYLPDGITCKPDRDPSILGFCLRGLCLPRSTCNVSFSPPPALPLARPLSQPSTPLSSCPLPSSSSSPPPPMPTLVPFYPPTVPAHWLQLPPPLPPPPPSPPFHSLSPLPPSLPPMPQMSPGLWRRWLVRWETLVLAKSEHFDERTFRKGLLRLLPPGSTLRISRKLTREQYISVVTVVFVRTQTQARTLAAIWLICQGVDRAECRGL